MREIRTYPSIDRPLHLNVSPLYIKFFLALHRPFATFSDPSFYVSRNLARVYARQHYRDVCAAFRDIADADPFATLIAGNGTLFRIEAIQSVMWLAYELYCSDHHNNGNTYDLGDSTDWNRVSIREMLTEVVVFTGKAFRTRELAGLAYLVPTLVLQHLTVLESCILSSWEYSCAIPNTGQALLEKFSGFLKLKH